MPLMAEKPKPKPAAGDAKRKRHTIFLTLDDDTEERLQAFLARHRVKPDRAAVAFAALIEFLDREERAAK